MPLRSTALLLFVLPYLPSGKAATTVSFNSPPRDYSVSNGPNLVATGDFNNDGKTDLIVSADFGNVEVLLGNGDGTFQTAQRVSSSSTVGEVAVGDVNGDGNLDIVLKGHTAFLYCSGRGTGRSSILM